MANPGKNAPANVPHVRRIVGTQITLPEIVARRSKTLRTEPVPEPTLEAKAGRSSGEPKSS